MSLTAEQKAARRAARQAWTARERERRAAMKPPSPAQPRRRPPVPPAADHTGWSDWCDEHRHDACPRTLTCRCPCHDRAD